MCCGHHEVNTGNPGKLLKKNFVELKIICDNDKDSVGKSLQGYKLIGLSGGTGTTSNLNAMSVDLVVNLWNSKVGKNGMFTIGAPDVPNTDMSADSDYVNYRNKFSKNTQTLFSMFNKGNRHLHAIALLYKASYSFPELVISEKTQYIPINSTIEELIRTNLVDMVVYGRKAPYDNCEIFTNLCNQYATKDYVLREFDCEKTEIDRTLNRCSLDKSTFVPEKFKLGSPTPGQENDCSGPNFLLETYLAEISDPLQSKAFDDENIDQINEILEKNDTSQCYASTDASTYYSIPEQKIEDKINEETGISQDSGCSTLNLGSDDGNVADNLDRINRSKRRLSEDTNYEEEFEWETTSHFE